MSCLRYSIVIPAYNEERRLPATLDRVLSDLGEGTTTSEIIVVDDGSQDKTPEVVLEYRRDVARIKLLRLQQNSGKGAAVRRGMLLARGEIIVVTDADINNAFSEYTKLVEAVRNGADVAIASRWSGGSEPHDSPVMRKLGSRFFRGLFRSVLGLQHADTQCGLKAFTRSAARSVLPYQTMNRWCWDAELLLIANRLGLNVTEVPVTFTHDYESSKFRPVADGMRSLREVLQIALRDRRGMYPVPMSAKAAAAASMVHMRTVAHTDQEAA